jgi:predicted  nucleic acid-binding Zn-ribbon protein
MDFSSRMEVLQQQVTDASNSVHAATSENVDQLRRRIDQAQAGNQAAKAQPSQARKTRPGSKWDQMRSDAADKMNDVKARIERRNQQIDADMAATDAELAEADANDAIDYAVWTVDNARLAVLDAIDARAYAQTQGGPPS